jgi:ribosomal protein S18 acetylase RimI-like enzyme
VIQIRPARTPDAMAIAAVHVAVFRTAYAGILPESYLADMSVSRNAAHYGGAIRTGAGVVVASASGEDLPAGVGSQIVGFSTAGRPRGGGRVLAEGEIETLYVLEDWRDRGIGRDLIRASGAHLAELGCRSAYLWVLRENPSRWFYQRLGGRVAMEAEIRVGGKTVVQTAYVWDSIERLLG